MTLVEEGVVVDLVSKTNVHDVDSYITELPDLWTRRMSKRWGDDVPRVRRDPLTGQDRWYIAGQKGPRPGLSALRDLDEETALGASHPDARLRWMDRHGISSQILYPNLLGFYPRLFMKADRAFSAECVRAYNEFQNEFCAIAPRRLIPLALLPWWDLDASIAELERCHDEGHRGVTFPWDVERVGLPPLRDGHWEPLLKLIEELGLPVNFHTGFGSENLGAASSIAQLSKLDQVTYVAKFWLGNADGIAELIMGRICERYPALMFVSVGSGVGYLPYLIEALDWQFLNEKLYEDHPEMLLPSEYFRRQIHGTFWFERAVARFAHDYPDNLMFETGFPQAASLTPTTRLPHVSGPRETIVRNLDGVSEEVVVKLLQGNAARLYQLDQ